MKIMNNSFLELEKEIKNANSIFIGSHVSPDGDNLGSSLGLYWALKKLDKDVKVLYVDPIPENYKFLPGIEDIVEVPSGKEVDLFIALDCGDKHRLGQNEVLAENAKVLMNIDHHASNPYYGDYNIVLKDSSSTAEVVYQLLKEMNIPIDKKIATNIYTGISADTGSFMYSNTGAKTHKIVAELYEYDIDIENININLYQSRSLGKTKLFSKALSDLELYYDNKVGLIYVSLDMLKKSEAKKEDTEGLVENIRDIENIEVAVLLKEEEDYIRVSTRSKEYVDVSKICSAFDGGGHKRASGCTLYGDVKDAKTKLLKEIGLYI